jgi:hypothetical protein
MDEKYKWVIGITIGLTVLILLIVFIKPSKSAPLPPGEVNCCINGQCRQLETDDCAKQGGVPNCRTCSSGSGVNCGRTMLPCTTDTDCHECQEFHQGVQMSCVQPEGSSGGKVCAPSNAKQICNTKLGGINVWSEWDNPDRMEWDCLCSNGSYAGGADADGNTSCNLNPDICQGGTFTWDIDKKTNPDDGYCFCPKGTVLYTQVSGGYPICVPAGDLTEMMYTDLYVKDGRSCPNLCGRRGTCGKDNKCVCDFGWGNGAGDCNGQTAIQNFPNKGAIRLTSNPLLGLNIAGNTAVTLNLSTPMTAMLAPDNPDASKLYFYPDKSVYNLTIDERTGHIFPSTVDNTWYWALSSSATTGHLVGMKNGVYYFATGFGDIQTDSMIIMKEQTTLNTADNILSFTVTACTAKTCGGSVCGGRGHKSNNKCVCDFGWGNGAGDCNGQTAIQNFPNKGSIALSNNALLGLNIVGNTAVTLNLSTPMMAILAPDNPDASRLYFYPNKSDPDKLVYNLTIDERTGHIFPSTVDNTWYWALSSSATTGHLVGMKNGVYYFATGPVNIQTDSMIIMKEQTTLNAADNILSFTVAACTAKTCGGSVPTLPWAQGVR